jgi:glutamyl-tRNA reductase
MQLCAIGVNHKTTPVTIRGKLAIGASRLRDALESLSNNVSPGIILGTCNRTEIYTVKENGAADEPAVISFLNTRANLPREELMKYIYVYHGEAAARHLFQVASGLDSMIIGEYEILGQVRHALEEAEGTRLVGLPLLDLFRHAVGTGRRVRAETGLSSNAISISSVAVDMAAAIVGDIRTCKVVVIGAGEAGRLVARTCRERGVSKIVVASRSREKGESLAAELHGDWVPIDDIRQALCEGDIVISCSGAPHAILKSELIADVMSTRQTHPLVIIDIAVPPDVEEPVKRLPNVFLHDIDEIIQICDANKQQRESNIQAAEAIIDEEVSKFDAYWQGLEVRPVINALMGKAENIRCGQLNKTLKKLSALSDKERYSLDMMTRSIVTRILSDPIQFLKLNTGNDGHYAEMVKELFQLGKGEWR